MCLWHLRQRERQWRNFQRRGGARMRACGGRRAYGGLTRVRACRPTTASTRASWTLCRPLRQRRRRMRCPSNFWGGAGGPQTGTRAMRPPPTRCTRHTRWGSSPLQCDREASEYVQYMLEKRRNAYQLTCRKAGENSHWRASWNLVDFPSCHELRVLSRILWCRVIYIFGWVLLRLCKIVKVRVLLTHLDVRN